MSKTVDWITTRLQEDVPKKGVTVLHLASGRLFLHKHGYDVPSGHDEARFNLKNIKERMAAQRWLHMHRECSPGITHIVCYMDGLDYVLVPIQHLSNHYDANNQAFVIGETTYGKCRGPYQGHELATVTKILVKPARERQPRTKKTKLEHKPMHLAWGMLD